MFGRTLLVWVLLICVGPSFAQHPLPRSFRGKNLGYAWKHDQAVCCISRSLTGQQFVTLAIDGSVVVWNWEGLSEFCRLKTDGSAYVSAAISGDAELVALVGPDTVDLWDTETESRVHQLKIQADAGTPVAFLRDKLATVERTGTVCLWSTQTGKKLQSWAPEVECAITGLSTSRDGNSVFFKPQFDDFLMRWNADETQPERFMWLIGKEQTIGQVDYCEQAEMCLTCDSRKISFVPREPRTKRQPRATTDRAKFDQILGHALSADGQFAVMYAGDNTYQVVEPDFRALHVDGFIRPTPDVCRGLVWPAPVEKGGWYAITGYEDGRISTWHLPGSPTKSVAPTWYNAALKALKEEDFSTLDHLYKQVQFDKSPLFTGRNNLQELMLLLETESGSSEKIEDRWAFAEAWQRQNPDSYAAHLLESRLHRMAASEVRGSRAIGRLTPEQITLMYDYVRNSRRSLQAAAERGPKDSEYYAMVVAIALLDPNGRQDFDDAIADCLKQDSRPIRMLSDAVNYLLPRWHGEPGELARFIAETADRIGGDDGEEMFVRMVNTWWEFETRNAFAHNKYTYDRYRIAIENMKQRYPLTTYWKWWWAMMEFYNGKSNKDAINEIRLLGGRTSTSRRTFDQIANWVSVGMTCVRVHRQQIHKAPVTALSVNGNDSMSFAENGALVRTDLKNELIISQWESESDQVAFGAAISTDAGNAVIACGKPGETCSLRRVIFDGGELTAETIEEFSVLSFIDGSDDNGLIAAISGKVKGVSLIRPDDATESVRLNAVGVEELAVAGNGVLLCTSDGSTSSKVWLPDGQMVDEVSVSGKPTWSQNAQRLAIHSEKQLRLFDIKRSADSTGTSEISVRTEPFLQIDLDFADSVVALSNDGRFLAIGDIQGVLLYDFLSKGHLPRLEAPRLKGVRCLKFTPDNKSLLVGGNSGYVSTYDITRFTRPRKRTHWVYEDGSVEQQPDGTWVERSGDDRFEYVEKQRTLDVIDLYDPNRDLWIRLITSELLRLTKESPVWTRVHRGKWNG